MAEVTITTTSPDSYYHRDSQGLKVRRRVVTVASDGDTYTSGIKGIQTVWWLGDAATDLATCEISNATTGEITFQTGGAVAGQILIESRG